MNLHLQILEKLIELPSTDQKEIRRHLDELGLEVKGIEGDGKSAVFNVETSANRGDHLSAWGIARELSARFLTAVKHPPIAADLGDRKPSVGIRRVTDKCFRYGLLEMTIPPAMALRADVAAVLGGPKHHPLVDTLNYMLLELGQPMHAFDRDKIDGEISVVLSEAAEQVIALDGKTYKVPEGSILIRDKKKTVAVAGVIGCQNSMVTAETKKVLIESAVFDPVCVRMTARRMGISTDASYTFQRGGDVDMYVTALKRLVYLLGGAAGAVKEGSSAHVLGFATSESGATEKRVIKANLLTVKKQMNLPRLPDVEIVTRLKYLGYAVTGTEKEVTIVVPSWRLWDVRAEEDLVEDFARSHGLMSVKQSLPPLDYETVQEHPRNALFHTLEPVLVGAGFNEVITRSYYSSTDAKLLSSLDSRVEKSHVTIKNALDSSYSHMRVSTVLHLGKIAVESERMGVQSCKIYERGRVYMLPAPGETGKSEWECEREVLCLAATGRWYDNEWRKPESLEESAAHMKGLVETLGAQLGTTFSISQSEEKFLHPGVQGLIKAGRSAIGYFGLVHPSIKAALDLRGNLFFGELDVEAMIKCMRLREYTSPIDFPSVKRDLTLRVGGSNLASKVCRFIEEIQPANLQLVTPVDTFKKSDEDFRRLSLRLTFQNAERTLASEEVDGEMAKILAHLKKEHNLELA